MRAHWLKRAKIGGAAVVALLMCGAALASDPPIEFNRDIRPILAENCFKCHGPDSATRKADLRLDRHADALADLGGYAALVPGDPAASELYRRITSDDVDDRMPPAKSKLSLNRKQIEMIRRWIEHGAPWQEHWSFIPPKRPALPAVKDNDWPRNPIDYFILARLEREGLSPSPEADKATLIRRVTLDLTGLPPTPEQVEAFMNDNSADAYEKLVDRLLRSPKYGERMALPWLDAARYADTNGYQNDGTREMWRWRDWVIEAYNRNLPFDQFTIQQLAGDMLPDATLDQIIATGFNRNHRGNSEGGVIPEEFQVEYVVDRVDTTGTVWMGLTLGCARCHDHKYDPVSQTEYYQLYAFFNNVPEMGRFVRDGNTEPYVKAPTDEQQKALAEYDRRIAAARHTLEALEPRIATAQAEWESTLPTAKSFEPLIQQGMTDHFPLDDSPNNSAPKAPAAKFVKGEARFAGGVIDSAAQFDGKRYIDAGKAGEFKITTPFSISVWFNAADTRDATILSRLEADTEKKGYELTLRDGRLALTFITRWVTGVTGVETVERLPASRWHHVVATYDGSMSARGMQIFVDGARQELNITYNSGSNVRPAPNAPLRIGARPHDGFFRGSIDDVRFYNRVIDDQEVAILADAAPLPDLAAIPAAQRTATQAAKLRRYFLDHHAPADVRKARENLHVIIAQRDRYYAKVPTVMVMKEMPEPRATHVLNRGQYDAPGERVQPGVPAVMPALPDDAVPNRLALARWLVSGEHPLTGRVAVNRYWQMYFGTGLVKTAEDFGTQGELPSHPQLLDWLASEFPRIGWDIKAMQKLIVTSATYRQSSRLTPKLLRLDPENRLLARGPRLRLPAHVIRDQALAAAGLLVADIGGPSVKPYQPDGLWKEQATGGAYKQDTGDALYRRSLYTFFKRTIPPPTMATFDAADRESCRVNDQRTNTPLQALVLMNDPTFIEASRVLAQRMMRETASDPADRVTYAFRALLSRTPTDREMAILSAGYERNLARYRGDIAAAGRLITVGEAPLDTKLNAAELAASTTLISTIMNLDEAIMKE